MYVRVTMNTISCVLCCYVMLKHSYFHLDVTLYFARYIIAIYII